MTKKKNDQQNNSKTLENMGEFFALHKNLAEFLKHSVRFKLKRTIYVQSGNYENWKETISGKEEKNLVEFLWENFERVAYKIQVVIG